MSKFQFQNQKFFIVVLKISVVKYPRLSVMGLMSKNFKIQESDIFLPFEDLYEKIIKNIVNFIVK